MAERELKCLRCGQAMRWFKRINVMLSDGVVFPAGEETCPHCGAVQP